MKRRALCVVVLAGLYGLAGTLSAQTTGKITGKVTDARNGEALIGANVLLEGTSMGAVASEDGTFYIINVPPGNYSVRVGILGFETVRVANVRVSVNRTTPVDVPMKQTVLQSDEVVVIQAQKVAIKKDQTGSIRNVSSEQIASLPVENVDEVVAMQAGIVAGHFRGGRTGEVSYMVDGMQVDNAFNRGRSVGVENEAIQDLEVITGTFNAEYGKAMSGMVNIVTKEGGNRFHGSIWGGLGNYLTPHKDTFIGLKDDELDRRNDFKIQLEGPIVKDRLMFFANYRQENNKDQYNGIHRFNPSDFSDYSVIPYISSFSGDGKTVPMSWNKGKTFLGKLTYKVNQLKMFLEYSHNTYDGQSYNHQFKYNPDGSGANRYNGYTDWYAFFTNYMFAKNAFFEFKLYYLNSYNGNYLYKNPNDSTKWVADNYLGNVNFCGFYTGGQDKNYNELTTDRLDGKFDVTWQVNRHHSLKAGVLLTQHTFDNVSSQIMNLYRGTTLEALRYFPVLAPDSTVYADIYKKKPVEMSGYLQDKMEFNEMVINLGLRYDYFDPKTVYPTNWRNPDNGMKYQDAPDHVSDYKNADAKVMISPRLGLSYQIGKSALLHFGYGHFFQAPGFANMYQNHYFLVQDVSYRTTVVGFPKLKAEKTVNYEVGLWQQLNPNMGLEVTLFYKDIYQLLTADIMTTYAQIRYGRYANKEYGNARGLEVKYDFNLGDINGNVNYTLQYTRGVADNPTDTYTRAGNNQDPIPRLIPLNWDQRHTLNFNVGYNTKNYDVTLSGFFGSGLAYTFTPIADNPLSRVNLYPNNAKRPSTFSVDLFAQYKLGVVWGTRLKVTLNVYNLFDAMNELYVNGATGRANQAIVRPSDLASFRSDFTDYYDQIKNPSSYSAPRLVKLGLGMEF